MSLHNIDWSALPLTLHSAVALGTIAGLWVGSDITLKGARGLAQSLGVSPLLVGLTIVSVISSLPEIFINISAGLRGADNIVIGNVIGSCFVQISLVLGLCTLIAGTLKADEDTIWRDGAVLIAANVLTVGLVLAGSVNSVSGFALIIVYVVYLGYLIGQSTESNVPAQRPTRDPGAHYAFRFSRISKLVAFVIAGCFLVWFMAEILVDIGTDAALRLGIDSGIIGIWTGAGTSIPELAISTLAALKGAGGLSIGNLVGSNITDPLLSLGIGTIAADGLEFTSGVTLMASVMWLSASIFAIGVFWFRNAMTRLPAVFLLLVYPAGQYWLIM